MQLYEKELGYEYGYISGNTTRRKEFATEVNLALDEYLDIGFKNSGTWQLDDTNHDDSFPIIKTDLIANQRIYTFLEDDKGNLILDIHRVMVAHPDGTFHEITPVDQQTRNSANYDTNTLIDEQNMTGVPTRYDKTTNGIFLDLIPNYNMRLVEEGQRGLKVIINREGSYFTEADTTKKPGVPGLHHKYFFLRPALNDARRRGLPTHDRLLFEVSKLEQAIKEYFGKRERDIIRRLTPNREQTR